MKVTWPSREEWLAQQEIDEHIELAWRHEVLRRDTVEELLVAKWINLMREFKIIPSSKHPLEGMLTAFFDLMGVEKSERPIAVELDKNDGIPNERAP